ncbi:hypothetical protein ACHAWF_005052 [Thalassiosira exigua]
MGKKSGGRVRVKQVGAPKMPANPLADLAIPPDEMIHLPPKPDSNSGFLLWPMEQTFTMNYKNFTTIYPNYIDSNKTVKYGRRIAAKDAVSEPTIQDIHEALVRLNIRHVIQPHKGYSRDASSRWDNPGRILVDFEGALETGVMEIDADGAFDMDDAIPDMGGGGDKENSKGEGKGKKHLLRKLASIIPDLPGRQKWLEEKTKLLEEERLKSIKAEKESSKIKSGGSGAGGGNRKKKGKKKK